MLDQKHVFVRTSDRDSRAGFSLIETMITLTIALLVLLGAYALVMAAGRHHRDTIAVTGMYAESRIAVERLSRDISETSDATIMVRTTSIRAGELLRDDAISFASARDGSGVFQLGTYGAFGFTRPIWQKAIVYYLLADGTSYGKTLYRTEIPKTNWNANYNPTPAMDGRGEAIARNVDYMYFGDPYPVVDPVVRRQDHVLQVSLGLLRSLEEMEAGPARLIRLDTGIPIMNRDKK